jgi:Ca2+-binding EF-hand superfamily protein
MSNETNFEIRQIFEYEIHRNLSMRAKTTTSEMSFLNNAFRFYDINNSGIIGKNEWIKVFAKIGLNGFSEKDLLLLFDIYDINKAGLINYKNFTSYLYDQADFQPVAKQQSQNTKTIIKEQQTSTNTIIGNVNQQKYQPVPYEQNQKNMNQQYNCSTPSNDSMKLYFKQIIDGVRSKVNTKCGFTFYIVASKLKDYEDKNSKMISFESLIQALKEAQVEIDYKMVREFYMIIDVCDENKVQTKEILRLFKGQLSEQRKNLIVNQFANIDKENKGICSINLLKSIYNSNEHPEVKMSYKTPNDNYKEFLFCLNSFLYINGIKENIKLEDFIDFYHGISSSINDDIYFADMIGGVWKLINTNSQQKQIIDSKVKSAPFVKQRQHIPQTNNNPSLVPNRRFPNANLPRFNPICSSYTLPQNYQGINQFQPIQQQYQPMQNARQPQSSNIIFKLRNILKCRGIKGLFGFQRMLKLLDTNNTHTLTKEKLLNLNDSYRLNLTNQEISNLISSLNHSNSQTINTDDLLQTLIEQLPPFRFNLINEVFQSLDSFSQGYISTNNIKTLFNAKRHPEVISNKRSEGEVLGEWLDNFEIFCEYNGITNVGDRKISFEEFKNFYSIISMSIEDDKFFEYMIIHTWNLDQKRFLKNYGNNPIVNPQ